MLEDTDRQTDASSKGSTAEVHVENRVILKRLRRNAAIADALMRIKMVAPEIDGNARYGQYLAYVHGGLDSPGLGRHYAFGSYTRMANTSAALQTSRGAPASCAASWPPCTATILTL